MVVCIILMPVCAINLILLTIHMVPGLLQIAASVKLMETHSISMILFTIYLAPGSL